MVLTEITDIDAFGCCLLYFAHTVDDHATRGTVYASSPATDVSEPWPEPRDAVHGISRDPSSWVLTQVMPARSRLDPLQ